MLSLKATLKAIGESITTIKSALDGKATKYTGYGTPVTLTTSWYTIPSDGFISVRIIGSAWKYVTVKNADGSNSKDLLASWNSGATWGFFSMPVMKGQKAVISSQGRSYENAFAEFIPYI